jgi:hypothetical protein
MTKEEAIEQLQRHINEVRNDFGWNVALVEALKLAISALSENKTFDGMTNGEVIQALFPNADYCGGAHFMHITNVNSIGEVSFPWKWWNAPYKAESEE